MTPQHRENGTAVITGASSGIGMAFARALAARGHHLVLIARRHDLLDRLADELRRSSDNRCEALACDLAVAEGIVRAETRILQSTDIDFLVNSAGFGTTGLFAEIDVERQLQMIMLHIAASVRLTRVALPQMMSRGRGSVVNVSSLGGILPVAGNATYCGTKAFLNTFSETLDAELKGSGVRVQALCPGATRTGFHDAPEFRPFLATIPSRMWMTPEQVVSESLRALEAGRAICIPGIQNRLLAAVVRRLAPLRRAAHRRGKQAAREAAQQTHAQTAGNSADS